MKLKEVIEEKLNEIWTNNDYSLWCKYPYMYPEEVLENAILFIGINPSLTEADLKITAYKINQEGKNHRYFNKYVEISKYCNYQWAHFDLLFFRETQQNKIKAEILKTESGRRFINEQLKVSKQLVLLSKPKVIVVSNAFASELVKNMGFNLSFDEQIGTYILKELNVPVFFSGMLTGQRALDTGSLERLKWHVRKVLS
jgi:hypothetical protein